MENKKISKKCNRGITLIALIVTVVILVIISSVVSVNLNTGQEYRNYQKMCSDISILEEKIAISYNKDKDVYSVITGDEVTPPGTLELEGECYQINPEILGNVTLNYGKGDEEDKDIYIVNLPSMEVYYLKGVKYEGNRYYKKYNQDSER